MVAHGKEESWGGKQDRREGFKKLQQRIGMKKGKGNGETCNKEVKRLEGVNGNMKSLRKWVVWYFHSNNYTGFSTWFPLCLISWFPNLAYS